jgi:dTDP-4-amino-4,6-dideoxy-D-galactose acyltransferase
LVDKKVEYALSDTSQFEPNHNVTLWDNYRGVTDDLLHLALVSGQYSRFKLDENLPAGSYERLYSRWIEKSVNGTLSSEVFCYMVNEIPRGLVTLDIKNGVGTIGLVAIHEDFQHQGIGIAMMRHVIYHVKMKHCLKLSVATQFDNLPACRLYEKSGFVIESITDVWHWWL